MTAPNPTINKEVVVWNVLARPYILSSVIPKVENSSLDSEPLLLRELIEFL